MGRIQGDMHIAGLLSAQTFKPPAGSVGKDAIPSQAGVEFSKLQQLGVFPYSQARRAQKQRVRSVWFDLDNGAGATIDDVVLQPTEAITITAASAVYVDATSGTVAAGSFKVGSTLGGGEVVAATNYQNAKAVGTSTAGVILNGAIAAGGSVFVRHTGVAATAAGQVRIHVEYTLDSDANQEIYDVVAPAHIAYGSAGAAVSIEAMLQIALPTSSRAHTIDLHYGTPGSGYASVLTTPITLNASSTLRTAAVATFASPAYVDGGSFRWVVASSGSGVNGKGLIVTTRLAEDPLNV